ncbi:hypothetical protein [Pontibacter cellulosilyticus]|uniref:STAS/SEC14 domain-containing protein n=1 Tax=Pontibacter cellulosilyticus TaxID=1720253 RepID=A0A923N9U4_9BACT|nr:hypothetical protein [Pontibacter cellulosilyticus]MBC5994452.1 hypothetical protein [Pontibacter cellulosilyticus]
MQNKTLVVEPHITIGFNSLNHIIYVDWTGDQTKESVQDGCEKMLDLLKQYHCTKVLNDNTNVTSIWLEAAWWVAVDWFPRMYEAGCRLFAWVESPHQLGKLSIEETLKFEITGVIALTFQNKQLAEEWLLKYDPEMK